jgi:hypothetical protein
MPSELRSTSRNIIDQIIPDANIQQVVEDKFLNVDVDINKLSLYYSIADRGVYVGDVERLGVELILPDEELVRDNWIFDGVNNIVMEGVELDINLVSSGVLK